MNSTWRRDLVAFQTIAGKEIRRFLRIWMQTILPPGITTTLYLIIFGNLIGPRIGEMDGYRYIDYIAPGIIMMAIITSSYGNVVSSFFGAKFQRYVEEMLISPTPEYLILAGFIAGGVARGLVVGLVVTAVATLLADLHVAHALVTLAVALMTATLFSLAGFVNAVFAKSFDDISIVPTFVLTPLTYLGGVFYSIALLPDFWRHLSLLNPVLYMVNAFRFGILGVSDIGMPAAIATILAFTVGLFVLCLVLLNKGVGLRA